MRVPGLKSWAVRERGASEQWGSAGAKRWGRSGGFLRSSDVEQALGRIGCWARHGLLLVSALRLLLLRFARRQRHVASTALNERSAMLCGQRRATSLWPGPLAHTACSRSACATALRGRQKLTHRFVCIPENEASQLKGAAGGAGDDEARMRQSTLLCIASASRVTVVVGCCTSPPS